MALYMDQFSPATVAAGATVYYSWMFTGAQDYGPNYVSASFVGAEDNYGTMTTVQTSIDAFYTNQYGYYWPTGISYAAQLRNDSDWPVQITLNIGDFQ